MSSAGGLSSSWCFPSFDCPCIIRHKYFVDVASFSPKGGEGKFAASSSIRTFASWQIQEKLTAN